MFFFQSTPSPHRKRNKTLGVPELIAIALGGMVGGGIFTVLGISVALVGVYTPVVIIFGGILAGLAAYSYVKLSLYYKDEGATYSFFKKTFPKSPFAASLIGWWVIFGYISTLALYAYTFSSYAISGFAFAEEEWIRKALACGIIIVFALINTWSVKGMGKIEDLLVYSKLVILAIISFVLINNSQTTIPTLIERQFEIKPIYLFIVAALTFVAYEGFQLVIHATNEIDNPTKDIPIAVFTAIAIAMGIYFVISLGAILAIPFDEIISNKEYALAAGTSNILGHWGTDLVIFGALLATSSAISGTVFGASRLLAVVANDGYFPPYLAKRRNRIPRNAIFTMSICAISLIFIGDLETILEFGSITFLIVSVLMAYANFKIRDKTKSSLSLTLLAVVSLVLGTILIFYYEFLHQPMQLLFIGGLYLLLTISAWLFSILYKHSAQKT